MASARLLCSEGIDICGVGDVVAQGSSVHGGLYPLLIDAGACAPPALMVGMRRERDGLKAG